MNDLVSIVVPIYNAERYLSDCIYSILNQTHKNIELILVNDGSTDRSLSICKSFEERDSRVKIIDKANGGVSSARNAGFSVSNGDYIGFVDSDDTIDSSMYEKLLQSINDHASQCAVLSRYTVKSYHDASFKDKKVIGKGEALSALFDLKFPTSLWAYLYRKEIVGGIKLKEDVHFFEDFEFNFFVLMKCKSISLCEERLYNYEANEFSINSQGVNAKRLSCLSIPERIHEEVIRFDDVQFSKKSYFFESHFLMSVISPLRLPFKKNQEYYIKETRKHIKKVWFRLVLSDSTPLKYKIVIVVGALDIRFLVLCLSALRNLLKLCRFFVPKKDI